MKDTPQENIQQLSSRKSYDRILKVVFIGWQLEDAKDMNKKTAIISIYQ